MAKSLTLGYFGDGRCDKCDQDKEDLLSVTFSDSEADGDPTTHTFCQECLSSSMGDVLENDLDSVEMLSMRAQNA